jgi:hypothetical protein
LYLKDRLRPAAPFDPRGVAKLVTDLDAERFEVRDGAFRELHGMDERALPVLRQGLEGRPAPGVKRYLEQLLARWHDGVPTLEQIRPLRAVEVLEHTRVPEARDLLRTLASGTADARLTREAKEALDRLERRNSAKP